ncbi:zinc ribbon domain-containing protein [Candidatus Pacearchaeota archaeon]|nr:zinc ribbon domain-containing protein [Candidatus Pacearchaeota archaeon]
MFKKKPCKNCGEKVRDKDRFCSNCGYNFEKNLKQEQGKQEDWGMLGKTDKEERVEDEFEMLANNLFKNFNSGFLGKMLSGTMKMLEKEIQKEMKQQKNPQGNFNRRTNFQLYINGKKVDPNDIKVIQGRENKNEVSEKSVKQVYKQPVFSKEKLERFTKLPRKEPTSNMKRFSDKIIYEIDVPGVKSVEDVLISRLENSIEIKALAKDKVYSKLLPISLPIQKFNLIKNKLFLHLGTN